MTDVTQGASMASKQAQDTEMVALKLQMDRLKADLTPGQNGKQKMRKACTDFEAVFISKMWEQMRATIPKGGMLHSPQEDMYRSMFDRDFAEKLASDGGFGLGDMLYNQLKDKIKDTRKIPGKLGNEILQTSEKASAVAGETAATTGQVTVKTGDSTTATNTSASDLLNKPSLKMPKRPLVGNAPTQTRSTDATPKQPASVPGEVMADVEALARRIEAEYDRRQTQTAGQSEQASGVAAVTTGAAVQGLVNAYGQAGRQRNADTGRKLAQVG